VKVYRVELLIIDHDGVGDEIETVIENVRYPNHCIYPHVMRIESRDIGEWSDEHPLNSRATMEDEYARLFPVRK
jgi:hypothetical protein